VVCYVTRALESDSRSLHSLSSQHRRLSPAHSSDPVVGALSRGDSMSSIISGTSLGSFTSTSQPDTAECTFISAQLCLSVFVDSMKHDCSARAKLGLLNSIFFSNSNFVCKIRILCELRLGAESGRCHSP